MSKKGYYRVDAVNKRSIRFTYATIEGKMIKGIISVLKLRNGFSCDGDTFPAYDVGMMSIAWETGAVRHYPRRQLVHVIAEASVEGDEGGKELVRALHRIHKDYYGF